MITKTEKTCFCGKIIILKGNWFNQYMMEDIIDLKYIRHFLRSHKDVVTVEKLQVKLFKRILLGVSNIFWKSLMQILFAVIWAATFPFRVAHEFVE